MSCQSAPASHRGLTVKLISVFYYKSTVSGIITKWKQLSHES
ncbi:unnamed protein product, partial [Staurois parvus]